MMACKNPKHCVGIPLQGMRHKGFQCRVYKALGSLTSFCGVWCVHQLVSKPSTVSVSYKRGHMWWCCQHSSVCLGLVKGLVHNQPVWVLKYGRIVRIQLQGMALESYIGSMGLQCGLYKALPRFLSHCLGIWIWITKNISSHYPVDQKFIPFQ